MDMFEMSLLMIGKTETWITAIYCHFTEKIVPGKLI